MYSLDRSLVSKTSPDKVSLSQNQVRSLKEKSESLSTGNHAQYRFMRGFLVAVRDVFTPRVRRARLDCRIEGHTLPEKVWKAGTMPRCKDCNKFIEDPQSLRRSL